MGNAANGQKWNFEAEVTRPSLVAVLTFVYSCTNGTYTDEGKAVGMGAWNEPWSNLWFMVAQAMSWLYEHGALIDYNVDRDGFLNQLAAEFLAAYKMYHDVYGWATWITDWNSVNINTIIDSADNGATGKTSLDIAKESMNLVWNFPQYFMKYRLWIYDWDKSQPWLIAGQAGTPMQKLLVAVPVVEETPPPPTVEDVRLTVKKLEAGTNQPLAGATFKIEGVGSDFSVTRTTGADGTITLTKDADNLLAGQYRITETSAPAGHTIQNASQVVTVLSNDAASSVFTFYNEPEIVKEGDGSIRKVDADNPTVGIPGAVIKLTSVKLDDGGSFTSTYTTGDGGYISKEDLDFSKLPTGSYVAEEITPPKGYILSSDVSKVKQAFTWDGEHDISLIFENSSKGLYTTNKNGEIRVSGVTGTIIVTETRTIDGYTIDEATRTQSVKVNAQDTQYLTFYNDPTGGLELIKVSEADKTVRIPDTTFEIRRASDGGLVKTVTTGKSGRVYVDLDAGSYYTLEIEAAKGYKLDSTQHPFTVQNGRTCTLTVTNAPFSGIIIHKVDSITGAGIYDVKFLVYDQNKKPIGEYVTDVYLEFGKVPVGFQSTGKPTLTVQVLGTMPNGYQIVNRANVGGCYLKQWVTAQAAWLTIVRKFPDPTLPKTGY